MEKEAKDIRNDTINLCWHMRGGIDYNQGMMLSPGERELIGNMIKEHMEVVKKTGQPYF